MNHGSSSSKHPVDLGVHTETVWTLIIGGPSNRGSRLWDAAFMKSRRVQQHLPPSRPGSSPCGTNVCGTPEDTDAGGVGQSKIWRCSQLVSSESREKERESSQQEKIPRQISVERTWTAGMSTNFLFVQEAFMVQNQKQNIKARTHPLLSHNLSLGSEVTQLFTFSPTSSSSSSSSPSHRDENFTHLCWSAPLLHGSGPVRSVLPQLIDPEQLRAATQKLKLEKTAEETPAMRSRTRKKPRIQSFTGKCSAVPVSV